MTLTEDSVEAFITNYVDVWSECGKRADPKLWKEFVDKFHKDDFCMIRPSGKPMSSDMLIEMTSSGDATNLSQDLVSVDSINIIGDGKVACVVYTSNQYFTFKGKANEDRVVSTAVVEEMPDGSIKVAHEHRCTGGVPIPI